MPQFVTGSEQMRADRRKLVISFSHDMSAYAERIAERITTLGGRLRDSDFDVVYWRRLDSGGANAALGWQEHIIDTSHPSVLLARLEEALDKVFGIMPVDPLVVELPQLERYRAGEMHAALYFGFRDDLDRLIKMIGSDAPGPSVTVLHGPSGCGKSSLLDAGLLTHLSSARHRPSDAWRWFRCTPELLGPAPMAGLAVGIAEALRRGGCEIGSTTACPKGQRSVC